ncbi:hypothetical protein G9A89_010153 [Geosiphon pyriformis]|nr:hypothetical protein G9A89_010153 [Geosiphon pyriformis]
MAAAVNHCVINPTKTLSQSQEQQQSTVSKVITTSQMETKKEENEIYTPTVPKEPTTLLDKLKQDVFLETPPSPGTLQHPPPPYSQWDELNLEQLLQKSREVLNGHSEFLAQGGNEKKTNTDMLDKMTQLASLVSSLQMILNDQTFAMHDLRSQLSDIQVVLKKMQDKQETMTSEEVMKQVVTMKALTENIMASSEVKRQLDASNAAAAAAAIAAAAAEITIQVEEKYHHQPPQNSQNQTQSQIEELLPSFEPSSPRSLSLSVILQPPSKPTSRTTSRQTSRAPSRSASRTPSRSASRTVSPSRTPVSSRTSSKPKIDLSSTPTSPSIRPYKGSVMSSISEAGDCGDDTDSENSEAFERMCSLLSTLITEATTAVEAPVITRDKKRQDSNSSEVSQDYFEDFDWDALRDDDENLLNQPEMIEQVDLSRESRRRERNNTHRRSRSRKEEEFEDCFKTLDSSMNQVQCLITHMTDELIEEEEAVIVQNRNGVLIRKIKDKNGIVIREEPIMDVQYNDPTLELINNPSADLADLDDFAQQCRLLTRALILPFLHATHSFMTESIQSSNRPNMPKSVTGTTRTFMNLMYWTFLFTLGSLVLDAWLCEVAGRQVIKMVGMLKPGQPFELDQNQESKFEIEDDYENYQGVGMVDSKKKNVKICTGLNLKTVSWRGVEAGVENGHGWIKNGAKGFMNLGKRSGRFLMGRRWNSNKIHNRSILPKNWGDDDDEMSEDSEEWELVDFDDSSDEDDESSEDDPALLLRRRITDERLKRAGHVKTSQNMNVPVEQERGDSTVQDDTSLHMFPCIDIQDEEMGEQQQQQQQLSSLEIAEVVSKETITMTQEDNDHVVPTMITGDENNGSQDEISDDEQEYFDDEDVDLQIPGSFPAAFRWAPSYSSIMTNTTMDTDESEQETVRRVRSVVLRRPRRNGPFGGSDGFWLMQTRKIRTKSSKKRGDHWSHSIYSSLNNLKEKDASNLLKGSKSKSSPISKKKKKSSTSKRGWLRRNSI